MYGALATRAEVVPVMTGEVPPAFIDRAACRLLDGVSGRRYLVGHAVATGRRKARAAEQALRSAPADVVVAAVASQEAAYLRTELPVVLVSDATFHCIRGYYELYSRLHIPSSLQGERLERRSLHNARHCVFASAWAEQSAIRDYSILAERCSVVPFGPALEPDLPYRPRSDPAGEIRLLTVASDWTRKGGDRAVRVFESLRAGGAPVSLTVVGDAPALPPEVRKAGRVDSEAMRALYATHDVVLELARANCAGVTLTDAAAFGLPVIASDTGGVSSIVQDGVTGFLVPASADLEGAVRQAVSKLLEPGAYAEMSGRARARSQECLSWDVWGRTMLDTCARLLRER